MGSAEVDQNRRLLQTGDRIDLHDRSPLDVAALAALAYVPQAHFQAAGVDFTDELSEKDYGVDFGIRDPFATESGSAPLKPS